MLTGGGNSPGRARVRSTDRCATCAGAAWRIGQRIQQCGRNREHSGVGRGTGRYVVTAGDAGCGMGGEALAREDGVPGERTGRSVPPTRGVDAGRTSALLVGVGRGDRATGLIETEAEGRGDAVRRGRVRRVGRPVRGGDAPVVRAARSPAAGAAELGAVPVPSPLPPGEESAIWANATDQPATTSTATAARIVTGTRRILRRPGIVVVTSRTGGRAYLAAAGPRTAAPISSPRFASASTSRLRTV